ncbi:unnamed protein product [Cuscuta epithymum]|uniref:Uncharacterized protein n=1 Tax=Cuscuta epithymum TaxID=186058 RepID=A0AAV0DSI3_9ASTE|nr:unnamed protein product [Cuscuta epithymum]
MAGSGDQVAALLFWGGQVIKNGYLGSVDYSEPPKTMCFLSGRGNRYEELVGKVHTAMNGDDGDTMFDLFGKYPTTLPGGKVLFVSIPLTDDQSLEWFLNVAALSQPVHVYAVAAPKRNDEPADDLRQVKRNQQQLNTPTGHARIYKWTNKHVPIPTAHHNRIKQKHKQNSSKYGYVPL